MTSVDADDLDIHRQFFSAIKLLSSAQRSPQAPTSRLAASISKRYASVTRVV